MKGLMMHCGANVVEEADVLAVETPSATKTHFPVPHSLLINLVGKMLEAGGWEVVKREYGLFNDGMRMFGVWAIRNGSGGHSDYQLTVGIRNSHDKVFPVGLVLGSHVFVCDNLCFSGLIKLVAKHTKNIYRDLPQKVFDSFGRLEQANLLQEERIEGYKGKLLDTTEIHDFAIRSVDQQVIPNSYIPGILGEVRSPKHEEFLHRSTNGNLVPTAWTLMNAYTERFKRTNALDLPGRTIRLHGMLDTLTFGELKNLDTTDVIEAQVVESTPQFVEAIPGMPPVILR